MDVPKGKYAEIKARATERSETVNEFIKRAIDETMRRDQPDKN